MIDLAHSNDSGNRVSPSGSPQRPPVRVNRVTWSRVRRDPRRGQHGPSWGVEWTAQVLRYLQLHEDRLRRVAALQREYDSLIHDRSALRKFSLIGAERVRFEIDKAVRQLHAPSDGTHLRLMLARALEVARSAT